MAIAAFMILDQLKIATNIVVITYAALVGAVALGMALAFGLGGRDVAGRLLETAYARGWKSRTTFVATCARESNAARQPADELATNVTPPPGPSESPTDV